MKIKEKININNFIIVAISIALFLAPILIFPRVLAKDYNIPKVIALYITGIILLIIFVIKIKKHRFDKKDILAFVFLLIALISLIFSLNRSVSLWGAKYRYEGFLMITTYILLYYFAKHYFREYKNFYNILFGIVIIICSYSIVQFYNLIPSFNLKEYWASGTFGNPNFLGSYITIFLPIFMALFILQGKKRYFLMSSIVFWSMLCTLTRSAFIAFLVYSLIGIIYIITKKDKILIKNALVLLLSFIIILPMADCLSDGKITHKMGSFNKLIEVIKERNTSEIENEIKILAEEQIKPLALKQQEVSNKSASQNIVNISNAKQENVVTKEEKQNTLIEWLVSGRREIYGVVIKVIKNHPIIGCGVDALSVAIAKEQFGYYMTKMLKTNTYIDKAHNEYMQIAATMGIPAMIIYLLFLFFICKDNMKGMFKNKITFILSLSIIGYLVQAFFNISTIGVAPTFWILLGLIQNEEFKKQALSKLN